MVSPAGLDFLACNRSKNKDLVTRRRLYVMHIELHAQATSHALHTRAYIPSPGCCSTYLEDALLHDRK